MADDDTSGQDIVIRLPDLPPLRFKAGTDPTHIQATLDAVRGGNKPAQPQPDQYGVTDPGAAMMMGDKGSVVPSQGGLDAAALNFSQGTTLNFGDEIGARVRSAFPEISNFMMRGAAIPRAEDIGGQPPPRTVSTAPTVDQRYEEELARARAELAASKAAYPETAAAANMVGQATTLSAIPFARFMPASTAGKLAYSSAAGGAALGVPAFGEGEGSLSQRGEHALLPTVIGTGLGAAAVPASVILRGGIEAIAPTAQRIGRWLLGGGEAAAPGAAPVAAPTPIVDPLRSTVQRAADTAAVNQRIGAEMGLNAAPVSAAERAAVTNAPDPLAGLTMEGRSAVSRIAEDMRAGKTTVDQARQKLDELGDSGILASVDKNLARRARDAYVLGGEGPNIIDKALDVLNEGSGLRMRTAIKGGPGAPDVLTQPQARRVFKNILTDVGDEGTLSRQNIPLNVSDEMRDIIQKNRYVREAISDAWDMAGGGGKDWTPAEIAWRVKRILNIRADKIQPGKTADPDVIRGAADEWERALFKANDSIKQFNTKYAQAAGAVDRLGEGLNWAKTGTGEVAEAFQPQNLQKTLAGYTANEKLALKIGAQNAMIAQASENPEMTRRLAKNIATGYSDTGLPARLQQIMPGEAPGIISEAKANQQLARTERVIRGGATDRTGDVQAALVNLPEKVEIPENMGGLVARALNKLSDISARVREPNEYVRAELARRLVNPNAALNQQTLDAIKAMEARRTAAQLLNPAVIAAPTVEPTYRRFVPPPQQ
jgi:hypothetical protein